MREGHSAVCRGGQKSGWSRVGFVLLTAGGSLGGAVVFVHGMRVLNLVSGPFERAAASVNPEEAARSDERKSARSEPA